MKTSLSFFCIGNFLAALFFFVFVWGATEKAVAAKPESAGKKGVASKQKKTKALTGKSKERYAIVYMRSNDFDKVLDYKEELETVFEAPVRDKLRVVGLEGGNFAIVYENNLSARTVTQNLVRHGELLSKVGFDEPYSTKNENFYTLFNISYGMGRDLDSLKASYQLLYSSLDEEVKRDLIIEKTDFNNYLLVYRLRADEAAANAVVKRQSSILRSKRLTATLAKENNNTVVYGESSLIDEDTDKSISRKVEKLADRARLSAKAEVVVSAPPEVPGPRKNQAVKVEKEVVGNTASKEPQGKRPELISSENARVEQAIADYLDTLREKGVIDKEEATGWMVYDLESDRNLVDINADVPFQAASMIKPFVALAFFHRVKEGRLQYDAASKRQLEAMIQRSSNPATNYLMRKVGGPEQCNALLAKHYGHIFKKTVIKEYIPADGRTYLNSASPADYVRFLRSLWNMELPSGKEIRRVMAMPGRDRLYFGTKIPRGTLVYNKTGTTARLCGDMGILVTKTRNGDVYPYAIVGIIERRNKARDYGQWMASRSKVIREVSSLVYEGLKKEHRLL
jgi:beta-lactamase class A